MWALVLNYCNTLRHITLPEPCKITKKQSVAWFAAVSLCTRLVSLSRHFGDSCARYSQFSEDLISRKMCLRSVILALKSSWTLLTFLRALPKGPTLWMTLPRGRIKHCTRYVCPSIPCFRFLQNRKAVGTSGLV